MIRGIVKEQGVPLFVCPLSVNVSTGSSRHLVLNGGDDGTVTNGAYVIVRCGTRARRYLS